MTCLPGCFTLYRIRTADKGRPLVVSHLIIDDYSEIHVDVRDRFLIVGDPSR